MNAHGLMILILINALTFVIKRRQQQQQPMKTFIQQQKFDEEKTQNQTLIANNH